MAQQTINIGASPNDGTGTPLRTAFQYTNSNFSELYTAVGPSGNNIVVPGNATITGDLTVDTNVLKVNTTTNRVGINTTTPSQNLEITGSGNPLVVDGCSAVRLNNTVSGRPAVVGVDDSQNFVIWNVGTEVSETIKFLTGGGNGKEQYRITHGGVFNWYDGAGGTRMTLNATGLGVGTSPSALLHVQKSQNSETTAVINNTNTGTSAGVRLDLQSNSLNYLTLQSFGQNYSGNAFGIAAAKLNVISENSLTAFSSGLAIGTSSSNPLYFATSNAVKMTLDASGNVGIGVTPSAWQSSIYKVLEFSRGVSLSGQTDAASMELTCNAYIDSAFSWIYKTTAQASHYRQFQGTHQWHTAPSGTAGNAITFTQAMTLDASGNLLCGSTALNATWNTRLTLSSDSGTTRWAVGPYSTATNFVISAASGGGVYLNGTAATSWTSASDERLKDIIEPISNAIAKVGSLRAVIGKFKSDDTNTRKSFLMAQDVQSVLPEAVDASNPDRLGLAYTDVIPLLVAAIKELAAEVNALKNA